VSNPLKLHDFLRLQRADREAIKSSQQQEMTMKTEVAYDDQKGAFVVTAHYAVETEEERALAARQALAAAKVPSCVDKFYLVSQQMTRNEANPEISEFFKSAGLMLSKEQVSKLNWDMVNELVRFVRALSPVRTQ